MLDTLGFVFAFVTVLFIILQINKCMYLSGTFYIDTL